MTDDTYKNWHRTIDSVSGSASAITASDTVGINATRAIFVGGGGNISVVMADGENTVVFNGVVAGSILPIRVSRVNATGTTATNLVGLY